MLECYAGFRIEAPAANVWPLINWSGIEKIQGKKDVFFKQVKYSTREPIIGATRNITLLEEGPDVVEVLLAYDEGRRRYHYGVIDGGNLSLGDYAGRVCVTPAGPKACTLCFSSRGVPFGISAADFQAYYTRLEAGLVSAIQGILGV